MEAKQIFKVGDRVEQMCETCAEARGHVVASVTAKGKITRVSCPKCGSRVHYKPGATAAAAKPGAPYDRERTYRRGQTMLHPHFGQGEVTAVFDTGKIDVLFADRVRRLIHATR